MCSEYYKSIMKKRWLINNLIHYLKMGNRLPHAKSWLIGKDLDAGRDWGQEEKGTTEDEMAGWHHWLEDVSFSELRELVMDREAWRAAIHGVAKSRTWLSDWSESESESKREWQIKKTMLFNTAATSHMWPWSISNVTKCKWGTAFFILLN